mgnify:CR=1 FL=1
MEHLKINIAVDPTLFIKDPESSELGKKIVGEGIEMINSIGYESFTFKKLGEVIGSNESSIYRYFENKHNLLAYLTMWYWSWMEYRIFVTTLNIDDPKVQLERAIKCLTDEVKEDLEIYQFDEIKLQRIVIIESSKVYFSKNGVWQNSGDPTSGATGTGALSITAPSAMTGITSTGVYRFASGDYGNTVVVNNSWNFGNGYFGTTAVASAGTNASGIGIFEYDVPTGFTALSTKGLNL